MEKANVFISYKSEEFQIADWVRQTLESHGISCWMAPASIPGGSNYAREIPQAIRNCRVFVLILSAQSQESQWIPREVDQAINMHKTIMPFMLEDCALRDDFNFYLSNVQRYAAYENKSRAMERMLREIQAILSVENEDTPAKPGMSGQAENTGGDTGDLNGSAGSDRFVEGASGAAGVAGTAATGSNSSTVGYSHSVAENNYAPVNGALGSAVAGKEHYTSGRPDGAGSKTGHGSSQAGASMKPQDAIPSGGSGMGATTSASGHQTHGAEKSNFRGSGGGFILKEKEKNAGPQTGGKKKAKSWLKILLASVVAIGIAISLFAAIYNRLNRVVIAGEEYSRDSSGVTLSDATLTVSDVQKFSKFKEMRGIHLTNCSIEADDLSPLLSETLGTLELTDCLLTKAQISSLDLSGTAISSLILAGNQNLESLELIRPVASKLQVLSVADTSVSDLSPLEECKILYRLNVSRTKVTDLSPLGVLERLTDVSASGNGLTSLTGLEHSLKLEKIVAEDNDISDLEGLTNATILNTVDLSNNKIADLEILKKSASTLRAIDLSHNALTDGTVFAEFPNLSILLVDDNKITALTNLRRCQNLKVLSAANTILKGTEDIEGLANLEYLNLYGTVIKEANLPNCTNGMFLELGGNPLLTDLTLSNEGTFTYIGLSGTSCSSNDLLKLKIREVVLPYGGYEKFASLKDVVTSSLYLVDCPLDKQVAIKDQLGYIVKFVSAAEAEEISLEKDAKNR